MLLLGGLTGIVCRDQTSTGTIAGPLALVFMLPTMFAGMGGVLQKVASFVPTTATADLMFLGLGHQSWMGANVLWDVAVLAVWTAGSAGLFALAFRKRAWTTERNFYRSINSIRPPETRRADAVFGSAQEVYKLFLGRLGGGDAGSLQPGADAVIDGMLLCAHGGRHGHPAAVLQRGGVSAAQINR